MGLKKNLLHHKKNIFLGLLAISLFSCSALGQWWYDRLDIYLANYFFKYADFSNEQKTYVSSVTKDYLAWNSSSEIPKYRNLIIKIRALDETTTKKDIQKLFKKGESMFKASNDFFTPHIVRFTKTISEKQIKEINLFFEERIKKWKESLDETKYQDPQEQTVKSTKRLARFLGVKLSEEQLITIKKLSKKIREPDTSYIERQDVWNKKLISILRKRESQNFEVTLTNHLDRLLDLDGRGNRNLIYHEILAKIIASLDEGQKKKFHKRLNFFISSLDKIIKNQK